MYKKKVDRCLILIFFTRQRVFRAEKYKIFSANRFFFSCSKKMRWEYINIRRNKRVGDVQNFAASTWIYFSSIVWSPERHCLLSKVTWGFIGLPIYHLQVLQDCMNIQYSSGTVENKWNVRKNDTYLHLLWDCVGIIIWKPKNVKVFTLSGREKFIFRVQ